MAGTFAFRRQEIMKSSKAVPEILKMHPSLKKLDQVCKLHISMHDKTLKQTIVTMCSFNLKWTTYKCVERSIRNVGRVYTYKAFQIAESEDNPNESEDNPNINHFLKLT